VDLLANSSPEHNMEYEHLMTQKIAASTTVDWLRPRREAIRPRGEAGRICNFLLRLSNFQKANEFLIGGRSCTVDSLINEREDGGCAGKIVFGFVTHPEQKMQMDVKLSHDARDDCGRLTLGFNPSQMLAGTDVAPTLIKRNTPAISYPSSSKHVASKLLRLGFDLLDSLHKLTHNGKPLFEDKEGRGIEDADIRLETIAWDMLLPTKSPRRFLEYLALMFVPPTRQSGKIVRLGELLRVKADFKNDADTGELESVTLKKIQGDRRNVFSIEFSRPGSKTNRQAQPMPNTFKVERNGVDRNVRLRLTAHPDGIAEIISAAQQKHREGSPRVRSVGGDFATGTASSRNLSLLSDGLEVLGNVVTGHGQLSRLSFGRWLARKALCATLNLDTIALFTRSDLDTLVGLDDGVAKAWRDSDSLEVDFKAVAEAAKVNVQTVRNRRSDWRRLYKIDISLPHAFYLTLVTVSPVVAMDGGARAALSKALSHPEAQQTFDLLKQAAKDFDRRRRTIIGMVVEDAQKGNLGRFRVRVIADVRPVPSAAQRPRLLGSSKQA
jgi:hypothetical protein